MRQNDLATTVQFGCALTALTLSALFGQSAWGQIIPKDAKRAASTQDLELLRSDVRAQKDQIMRQNFILPEEQAKKFWPLYREYDLELSKIWDKRQKLVERYVRNFRRLSDEEAEAIVEGTLATDEQMTRLRRRYFRKFKKSTTASPPTFMVVSLTASGITWRTS